MTKNNSYSTQNLTPQLANTLSAKRGSRASTQNSFTAKETDSFVSASNYLRIEFDCIVTETHRLGNESHSSVLATDSTVKPSNSYVKPSHSTVKLTCCPVLASGRSVKSSDNARKANGSRRIDRKSSPKGSLNKQQI